MRIRGNDYDMREAAGAFGDLGTLIPFLVGYLTIAKMDPVGVLVAFGVFKILAGLYFKTPVPIQPMKAIGTAAISHAGLIGPGAILASGLFSGILWLVMGLSGAVTWIARLTSRPVVHGLILGLGLSFILEGIKLMEGDYTIAVLGIALTFALLSRERVPAMLVLLAFGAAVAFARQPSLLGDLRQVAFQLRVPHFALTGLGWNDVVTGVLVLGLPHAALTLGNAIVATVEERLARGSGCQVERHATCATIHKVKASKTADHLGLRPLSPGFLLRYNPNVSVKYMRIVFSPIPVQQICFWLPVEPAHVKGTVTVADNVLWPEAALAELIADSLSLEAHGTLHHAWSDVAHLFVTDGRVKVLLHAPHQSCAVDIDDHIVAACFDARKRHQKEVGQERP